MSDLTTFMFPDTLAEIRVVEIEGEAYFVGKDVAEALGYANPNKAMGDHCKGVTKRHPLPTAGGMQEFRIINQSDVLRLVVKSQLPEAERFERWAFEDVLPQVLKTGSYGKPMSQAEALLQSVQMMVEQERRTKLVEQQQVQQAKALERLDAKVEQVAEQQVWTSRPQNAESITHLVPRLMRKYGLPERIIKEALRQLPYSPKPAGVVRNDNESARGSTYAVYWVADVNKVFDRFVRECHHETATQATHPFIEGRFKLVGDMVRA